MLLFPTQERQTPPGPTFPYCCAVGFVLLYEILLFLEHKNCGVKSF